MTWRLVVSDSHPLALILQDPDKLKGLQVDTLERLWAIEKEVRADDRRQQFHEAFTAAQIDLAPVRKEASNKQTDSVYAKLEDVVAMLDPVITKHGFSRSISEDPTFAGEGIRFVMTVRHTAGHSELHYLRAPVDNVGPKGAPTKTVLHGIGSSYSYVERIMCCKVWAIQVFEDDDGQAGGGPPVQRRASGRQSATAQAVREHGGTLARDANNRRQAAEAPPPEPVGETLPDEPTEPAKPFRNLNADYTGEIRELLDLWRAVPEDWKRHDFGERYMEFRKAIPTKPHARNFIDKYRRLANEALGRSSDAVPPAEPLDTMTEETIARLMSFFQATEKRDEFKADMKLLTTDSQAQQFIAKWVAIKNTKEKTQ